MLAETAILFGSRTPYFDFDRSGVAENPVLRKPVSRGAWEIDFMALFGRDRDVTVAAAAAAAAAMVEREIERGLRELREKGYEGFLWGLE